MSDADGYAPGYGGDALAMMRGRGATTHAASVLPYVRDGVRVLDVGCGPGTITAGIADGVGSSGAVVGVDRQVDQLAGTGPGNLRFAQASVYELPVRTGGVDVVFSHALFEHLARPADALAELRRVLRPGGGVVLCSSDWSGAVVRPHTRDVAAALDGHYLLRRRAGGDPFAGGRLPDLVAAAGFTSVRSTVYGREDMGYAELARYVGSRVAAAVDGAREPDRAVLRRATDAARRWAATRDGTFVQRWVEVTASAPDSAG